MDICIITVAGMATRFNKTLPAPAVKCIHYEKDPKKTLLYQLLLKAEGCDKIIVVGGYGYDALTEYADSQLARFKDKILFVYNPRYADYGSGYSLYVGLKEAERYSPDSVIFAEGDLFFDESAFERIMLSEKNVLTVNREPIEADKAVAVYIDTNGRARYLYDTAHKSLYIGEPFLAVYNSGQVWKLTDPQAAVEIAESLTDAQQRGTNLEIIARYFLSVPRGETEIIVFDNWINCNTVSDYKNMLEALLKNEQLT